MSTFVVPEREVAREAASLWWLFLVTGVVWLVVSLIILRFDYVTVGAISILFGVVAIFAGVNELMKVGASTTGWKIGHGLFGLVFVVIGIVAFSSPGNTFAALAGVMSFYLVFAGVLNVVLSIATKDEIPVWWLTLVIGIAEVLLGFWAAGYWGRSTVLLVAWVGATCLARGITEIVFAFKLHGLTRGSRPSTTSRAATTRRPLPSARLRSCCGRSPCASSPPRSRHPPRGRAFASSSRSISTRSRAAERSGSPCPERARPSRGRALSTRCSRERCAARSSAGRAPGRRSSRSAGRTGPTCSSCCPRRGGLRTRATRSPSWAMARRACSRPTRPASPGLVSLSDVATGRLRWIADDDPAGTLEALDARIDRNDRIRAPLTLVLVVAALAAALLRPRLGPRVLLLALAGNLWLAGWWVAGAVAAAALLLPLGWASAAVVAATALVLWLDPAAVALSPFGPSQAGRFYGVSNLHETMLLVPALLGAALLGRLGVVVGALAVVTVAGSGLGADGGGLLVLLAAYAALALRLRGARIGLARVAAIAIAVVAVGGALVGLDAALGASSHVTEAVGDGPWSLAGDLAGRVEISVRRTLESAWPALVVALSLAGLAWIATRRPRTPIVDALLVGLAVSLLVNDTPSDVLAIGAAAAIVLRRWERWAVHEGKGRG